MKTKSKFLVYGSLIGLVIFFLGVISYGFFLSQEKARAANTTTFTGIVPLAGTIWTPNTGWLSFSTSSIIANNARIDATNPNGAPLIIGEAWSSNLGWISFDALKTVGCPVNTANMNCRAEIAPATTTAGVNYYEIKGFAKILATGEFISLKGPGFGAKIDPVGGVGSACGTSGALCGYAWANGNNGWIDFNPSLTQAGGQGGNCPVTDPNYPNCTGGCVPGSTNCPPPPNCDPCVNPTCTSVLKACPTTTQTAGCSFTASPQSAVAPIPANKTLTLSWNCQSIKPGSCSLTGGTATGAVADAGTKNIAYPTSTTSYTLACVDLNNQNIINTTQAKVVTLKGTIKEVKPQ